MRLPYKSLICEICEIWGDCAGEEANGEKHPAVDDFALVPTLFKQLAFDPIGEICFAPKGFELIVELLPLLTLLLLLILLTDDVDDEDDDDEVFDNKLSIENGLMSGLVVTFSGNNFEKWFTAAARWDAFGAVLIMPFWLWKFCNECWLWYAAAAAAAADENKLFTDWFIQLFLILFYSDRFLK